MTQQPLTPEVAARTLYQTARKVPLNGEQHDLLTRCHETVAAALSTLRARVAELEAAPDGAPTPDSDG